MNKHGKNSTIYSRSGFLAYTLAICVTAVCTGCQDHHFESYEEIGPLPEPSLSQKSAAPRGPGTAPKIASPYKPADLIVAGKIDLAESVRAVDYSGWVLFVIARPAGGGAPLAAIKVEKPAFPLNFRLTTQDIMIGDVSDGIKLTVEARFDSDGDPGTKKPGDLYGKHKGPATIGDTATSIILGSG